MKEWDIERVKTYVLNLDEQMNGGIPKGHVVLVSGNPGTYKSSFAYNILYHNAKEEKKKGLYISFQQNRDSLRDQFKSLNMDYDEVSDSITIVDVGYLRQTMKPHPQDWIDVFKRYVENIRATTNYDLLVVDSLTTLEIISQLDDTRESLFRLFEWLRNIQNLTSILIVERPSDTSLMSEEEFLADGIIYLSKERMGRMDTQRFLTIDKMRATKHNTSFFTLLFNNGRFQITRVIRE